MNDDEIRAEADIAARAFELWGEANWRNRQPPTPREEARKRLAAIRSSLLAKGESSLFAKYAATIEHQREGL